MKKYILMLVFFSFSIHLYSQIGYETYHYSNDLNKDLRSGEIYKSSNGTTIPPRGTLRLLTIFVNIIYDQNPSKNPIQSIGTNDAWKPDITNSINSQTYKPTYMLNLFDTSQSTTNGIITRFYSESSFNQLILLSDFMLVNIKQSQITPNASDAAFNTGTLINSVVKYINDTGGLRTYYGYDNGSEYDRITPSKESGLLILTSPDTKVDLVNFVFRNTTNMYGGINSSNGISTGGGFISDLKIKNQLYTFNYCMYQCVGSGDITSDKRNIITHELAHFLLGGNEFHTSGGATNNDSFHNTFMGRQWGYGLFNGGLISCNGYERWRLDWRGSQNNAYRIAANNMNTDITGTFQGEKVFTLRDFVTYGDAIRIKLPYKDNTQSSNQYIWLENHQSGKNNKMDTYIYSHSGTCRDVDKAGIYAYYQIGKDVLESTNSSEIYPINEKDNLRIISAEGNYNTVYEGMYTDCLGWAARPRFKYTSPNPLQGVNAQTEAYSFDTNLSSLSFSNSLYLGSKNKNGTLSNNFPWLGDQCDVFVPNSEIVFDISTNPSPVNAVTYYSTRNENTMNVVSTQRNTRKIYLTGLSIKMIDTQPGSSGMKAYTVKIRWDDYDVKQNVNWAGDIILKEKLNLLAGKMITLEQNMVPNQLPKDPVANFYAPPTKFTCEASSVFNLASNSKVIVKDKSALIMLNGSKMNIQQGAEFVVELGSTFTVEQGAIIN